MKALVFCIILIPAISFAKIKIAIIDSGISEQEWSNVNYSKGYNFVLNSNKFPKLQKGNDHGTFLVGVLAGFPELNNKLEIIPIQFANLEEEDQNYSSRSNYYKSLRYAIDQKVDILSLSIVSHVDDPKERKLLEEAVKSGIKVFVASGNVEKKFEGVDPYPCSYNIKKVICVGNIDKNKKIISNNIKEVDIYVQGALVSLGEGGELVFKDGSSMSTAILAHNYALFKLKKEKKFLKFLRNNKILYKRDKK